MGEWSKSIGEKGEKIVKFIFEEILQFNSLIENNSIDCINGEKHKVKSAKNNKTTHGLDGLIYQESPLEDELLDTVIISAKYTTDYPKNPKTLFKSHLKDLAFTVECFKNSKLNNSINQTFSSITKTDITGILVWLSNGNEKDFDLTSKVNNILIDNELNFDKVILLDNNSIDFLFESIFKTNEYYGKENVDFVYHNSGLNNKSLQSTTFGKAFPINYFYSDIIPLRVEKDNIISSIIFINDDFSDSNLSQVLTFANTFNHLNSIDNTILNFRNYDNLKDESKIKQVLIKFQNYKLDKNLLVKKFPTDYRDF